MARKNKRKRPTNRFVKFFAITFLVVGMTLLAYVPLATLYNGAHATKVVSSYSEVIEQLPEESKTDILTSAESYNKRLSDASPLPFSSQVEGYEEELNVSGTQVMGRVVSDEVGLDLPIYHGTSDSVLMSGAGHLSGSSLPVGGTGTHCVLMGHTGMPETRLFDGIQDLKEGDLFFLEVLGERLAYKVDSVKTVLPDQLDTLRIEPDEDRCTLVTCTPYGINSHRLLVSGVRTDDVSATEGSNGVFMPSAASFCVALVFLVAICLGVFLVLKRRNGKNRPGAHRKRNAEPSITELAQERSISYAKNGW